MRIRPFVISLVGLALVSGGLRLARRAGRRGQTGERPPFLVSVVQAEPRSAGSLRAVGSLQAVREVMLAPDTAGRVTAIHFTAGQTVKEGAALVQLFDAPEQADRAAASAKADFALLQLRRSQGLAPSGAESREVLERAPRRPRPSPPSGNWMHASSRSASRRRSPARSASGASTSAST